MILLCSRFDSVLFTPKTSAIASYGNYSRSPKNNAVVDTSPQSDSEPSGRVTQLEAEIVALRQLIRRLQKDTGKKSEVT
jgi:hypothetical protein